MEEHLFPDTMFGFREHPSAQDILLQLKAQVIGQCSWRSVKAILVLDLKGAFENARHENILENLPSLHCGRKTYYYVRNFLKDRTAALRIGDLLSQQIRLGPRGTPQGSDISPLLFSIGLIRLPPLLAEVPGILYELYADDITVWTTCESTMEFQDAL